MRWKRGGGRGGLFGATCKKFSKENKHWALCQQNAIHKDNAEILI